MPYPWPNPSDFVDARWEVDCRDRLVAYLRSGICIAQYLGYAHCRFWCGIKDSEMGYSDLSDGEWVWPFGLAHYLEAHSVTLPAQFVEHVRSRNFTITPFEVLEGHQRHPYDSAVWKLWASQARRRDS